MEDSFAITYGVCDRTETVKYQGKSNTCPDGCISSKNRDSSGESRTQSSRAGNFACILHIHPEVMIVNSIEQRNISNIDTC